MFGACSVWVCWTNLCTRVKNWPNGSYTVITRHFNIFCTDETSCSRERKEFPSFIWKYCHSLKRNLVILWKVFVFHRFFRDLQGPKLFCSRQKRAKYIEQPAHSMKPKLLFEGRKRDGRRSSLLIVDEQMCTQLAAVVSFGIYMRYKLMKQCSLFNTVLLAISMIVCSQISCFRIRISFLLLSLGQPKRSSARKS